MHAILEDPKLPPDHKMKLYNQELQKAIDERQKVKQEFMIEVNKSNADFPQMTKWKKK